jgi:hypothetical protein
MHDCLVLAKGAKVKVMTDRHGQGRGVGSVGEKVVSFDESPAKRSRLSSVQQNTLTGPQDEARQAQ